MTAEVAVLNKSAVALAADSAVTISDSDGDNKKTYLANKLFALSDTQPIGIMVYGAAELLGIPWETGIREYRSQLKNKSFKSVREYTADFFRYLEKSPLLFTKPLQSVYAKYAITALLNTIRDLADEKVKLAAKEKKELQASEIAKLHAEQISELRSSLLKRPSLPNLPANFGHEIVSEQKQHIAEEKIRIFRANKITLSAASSRSLSDCIRETFNKGWFPWDKTGVVISGFGSREIFPHLYAFDVVSVARGKVMTRPLPDKSFPQPDRIAGPLGSTAAVLTFAQTDVMETLIEGCGRDYRDQISRRIFKDRLESIRFLRENLAKHGMPSAQISRVEKATKGFVLDQHKKFYKQLIEHAQSQINELLDTIEFLPKVELARLASALVELTSVKRKMSLEIETVGGPVDTAVISKGDGFVWINKKQYFDSEISR